ncbi:MULTISPECIES: aromatic-ring-hydroxylating dioxygenase subunit beta [Streptomyces]|uniref:Aromatic-ring-hydroxylating dioxygenase subunit beta n=1 Tax=Streptomyces milbemycinicus TaxID=476552 RepID=A0ABW8LVU7_9ACTN|nr:aromatic-ring-hydroxylating dioxygenase subunit beta [Streptomyces sp. FXJ1.4098]
MPGDTLSTAVAAAELPLDDPRALAAVSLIWREAHLLDARAYQEWDRLWAEGGEYVVPIDRDATDFASRLNLVYDDDRMRRMRIERLTGGFSISAAAAARTVRSLSRFVVTGREEDAFEIRSAQILVGYKREETFVLAADVTHRIVFGEGGARIHRKVVRLVNSEDTVTASGFLL